MELYHLIEAVNYIDDNLQNNIQLADIAMVAGYSKYHFDRLFRYAVGESLIEYVRKRKLTEASLELLTTDTRLIEIAIKYGFQSQQSFTTTFKKYFNITPRQYRLKGHRFVLLEKSKLSQLDIDRIHALSQIKVHHVRKEAFNVIGLEYFGSNKNNEIPMLWERFLTEIKSIAELNNQTVYLGLCDHVPDFDPEKSEFTYMACIEIHKPLASLPNGMIRKTISMQDYVVFTHIGDSDTLEATYKYIYGTYFFKSNYELADAPDFERYDFRHNLNSETSVIDIYIPVKPIG